MRQLYKFAIISLVVVLAGCNASNSNNNEVSQLKDQINQLKAENQQLKEQLPASNDKKSPENEPTEKPETTPESTNEDKNNIELNKKFVVPDFAEITLTKVDFKSKVVPPKPDGFYTYYEVKEKGNIYLDTVLNVKSLLTSGKDADEFASVQVTYDEKYKYDSFSTIEEGGGTNFTYTNITSIEPLKNGIIHFISELPKEASNDKKPINIMISINGDEYNYKLR